jgi:hypothetical protein
MFRHVSLLKFNDPRTDVPVVAAALSALPASIPALRDYRVGADAGLADGNFDLAIVADFDDVAGYESYRDDPDHQRILTEIVKPRLAQRAAAQYQI